MELCILFCLFSIGHAYSVPGSLNQNQHKDAKPYGPPPGAPQLHQHPLAQPLVSSHPDDHHHHLPDSVVKNPNAGSSSNYLVPEAQTEYDLAYASRRVEDTDVECAKTHMVVTLKFSAKFNGKIYPHGKFEKCILFHGHNSKEAVLNLRHGICGDQSELVSVNSLQFLSPVIEHRLMIQWEPDFICDDDASVIVRCERPDDFNKTIEWNFETFQLASTLEISNHPGPKMWMEIQKGEGPGAPPLESSVFIGDLLTLVFTLADDVFWFDSNVLSCIAIDGNGDKTQIEWDREEDRSNMKHYTGEMKVIENSCTVKPKIFSHFNKRKDGEHGSLKTLHYAHFKAFRFPTSDKVIIQCDVQVCYKNCETLPPCSSPIQPHAIKEEYNRRRREVSNHTRERRETRETKDSFDMDQINFHRTIVVNLPEDAALREVSVNSKQQSPLTITAVGEIDCYGSTVVTWLIVSLIAALVLLICTLVYYKFIHKADNPETNYYTK